MKIILDTDTGNMEEILSTEEFLHEQARNLMEKLDEIYKWETSESLDEYLAARYYILTPEHVGKIKQLLDMFDHL